MSFHPPLLAAGGAGMIIWLIIIVFWALSTMVQKSREKQEAERRRALRPAGSSGAPPPPPPPREPQREAADPEEELRRFLREITGMPTAQPKPQPAPPPPLPTLQQKTSRSNAHKRKTTPPPTPAIQFDEPPARPVRVEPTGAYANTSQEIGAANDQHIYETLDEIEDIEVLMSRQAATLYSGETMIRQDSMLVNLSKIRVPLMTLPFVSYKSVRHAVNRPPIKSDRESLRQALIARVVLGPCKAFDSAPGKDGLANK